MSNEITGINIRAVQLTRNEQVGGSTASTSETNLTDGLSQKELEEIDKAGNNDGKVTEEEFQKALKEKGGTEAEAQNYWQEYLTAYNNKLTAENKTVTETFDNNGKMTGFNVSKGNNSGNLEVTKVTNTGTNESTYVRYGSSTTANKVAVEYTNSADSASGDIQVLVDKGSSRLRSVQSKNPPVDISGISYLYTHINTTRFDQITINGETYKGDNLSRKDDVVTVKNNDGNVVALVQIGSDRHITSIATNFNEQGYPENEVRFDKTGKPQEVITYPSNSQAIIKSCTSNDSSAMGVTDTFIFPSYIKDNIELEPFGPVNIININPASLVSQTSALEATNSSSSTGSTAQTEATKFNNWTDTAKEGSAYQYVELGRNAEQFISNIKNFATEYVNQYGNNDGNLSLEEFTKFTGLDADDAQAVFNMIDMDKKDGITANEFSAYLMAVDWMGDSKANGSMNIDDWNDSAAFAIYASEKYQNSEVHQSSVEGLEILTNKMNEYMDKYIDPRPTETSGTMNTTNKSETSATVTNETSAVETNISSNIISFPSIYRDTLTVETAGQIIENSYYAIGDLLDLMGGGNLSHDVKRVVVEKLNADLQKQEISENNTKSYVDNTLTQYAASKGITLSDSDKTTITNMLKEFNGCYGSSSSLSLFDFGSTVFAHSILNSTGNHNITKDNMNAILKAMSGKLWGKQTEPGKLADDILSALNKQGVEGWTKDNMLKMIEFVMPMDTQGGTTHIAGRDIKGLGLEATKEFMSVVIIEPTTPITTGPVDIALSGVVVEPSLEQLANETNSTVSNQTSSTVTNETSSSVSNQPSSTVTNETSSSVSNQPSSTVTNETSSSVSNQPSSSVTNETSSSVTNQTSSSGTSTTSAGTPTIADLISNTNGTGNASTTYYINPAIDKNQEISIAPRGKLTNETKEGKALVFAQQIINPNENNGTDRMTKAEFIEYMKTFGIEFDEDKMKKLFDFIAGLDSWTDGTTISREGLATLIMLADLDMNTYRGSNTGTKYDYMDGKFTVKDIQNAATQIAQGNSSYTNEAKYIRNYIIGNTNAGVQNPSSEGNSLVSNASNQQENLYTINASVNRNTEFNFNSQISLVSNASPVSNSSSNTNQSYQAKLVSLAEDIVEQYGANGEMNETQFATYMRTFGIEFADSAIHDLYGEVNRLDANKNVISPKELSALLYMADLKINEYKHSNGQHMGHFLDESFLFKEMQDVATNLAQGDGWYRNLINIVHDIVL